MSDEATAKAFMQTTLASSARVRGQYTRSLLVTNAESLPLVDYRPGDWITAPTVQHGEKVRIQQVTVSLDSNGLKASITLNARYTTLRCGPPRRSPALPVARLLPAVRVVVLLLRRIIARRGP